LEVSDKRYSGICVTGPLCSKELVHYSKRYKVKLAEKLKFHVDMHPDMSAEFKEFEYDHVIGLRGSIEQDFWVPSGKDSEWAFRHIFQHYVDSAGVLK
jgi:hypothetical protein